MRSAVFVAQRGQYLAGLEKNSLDHVGEVTHMARFLGMIVLALATALTIQVLEVATAPSPFAQAQVQLPSNEGPGVVANDFPKSGSGIDWIPQPSYGEGPGVNGASLPKTGGSQADETLPWTIPAAAILGIALLLLIGVRQARARLAIQTIPQQRRRPAASPNV